MDRSMHTTTCHNISWLQPAKPINNFIPDAECICLSGYKSVKNKLLTNVDFPSPDSPEKYNNKTNIINHRYECKYILYVGMDVEIFKI